MNESEKQNAEISFVLMLKTAVAIAIIKTKPQHISGFEYAKQLYNVSYNNIL